MNANEMGVYKITNVFDGKFYIGSAHNIEVRWDEHKKDLKSNMHGNKYIQSAWNKNGEESFIFEVVQQISCEKDLLDVEQIWLDNTQCYNPEIGYNLSCVTRGTLVKYANIRQRIIDNITREVAQLYCEENTKVKTIPMISNLNGLFKKLCECYEHNIELNKDIKRNNDIYLSNCLIYTKTINFNLENILESKADIALFLAENDIEMIRVEDYCHNTNTINIYKNSFVWFRIEDSKLTLQSHYRKDEICLFKNN